MGTLVRAQIILKTVDAIPANYVTNTIYIDAGNVETIPVEGTAAIQTFYRSLNNYLGNTIATTGHMIKWSVVVQPQPNYPYDETTFSFAAALAGTGQPSEIAVCTSFQAVKQNGVAQASRRGRLYIGILGQNALSAGRPAAAFITALANATKQLGIDLGIAGGVGEETRWVVYSPKLGTFAPINDGWVDNAFDTQRRRGVSPTSRTEWDINV